MILLYPIEETVTDSPYCCYCGKLKDSKNVIIYTLPTGECFNREKCNCDSTVFCFNFPEPEEKTFKSEENSFDYFKKKEKFIKKIIVKGKRR